jgi:outer membrane protein assembly factor BamD
LAAANRAQAAISEYPNTVVMEDALTVLINAYDALGSTQLRDDAKRVMALNFPKNKLALKPAGNPAQKP